MARKAKLAQFTARPVPSEHRPPNCPEDCSVCCCGGAHGGAPHVERSAEPEAPTLRDAFATGALTGLLANSDPRDSKKLYVRMAFELADLMMAQRAEAVRT